MKKKTIIMLTATGLIILIIAIILLNKNITIQKKSNLEIIDATYACGPSSTEKFYEDDKYTYSFPCVKSSSIYVKFENGNKMLIVDALEAEKVTIEELIDAGLEVHKRTK